MPVECTFCDITRDAWDTEGWKHLKGVSVCDACYSKFAAKPCMFKNSIMASQLERETVVVFHDEGILSRDSSIEVHTCTLKVKIPPYAGPKECNKLITAACENIELLCEIGADFKKIKPEFMSQVYTKGTCWLYYILKFTFELVVPTRQEFRVRLIMSEDLVCEMKKYPHITLSVAGITSPVQ